MDVHGKLLITSNQVKNVSWRKIICEGGGEIQ